MDIGLVHRNAGGISCEFISGLFLPEQPSSKRPAAAAAAPPSETSLNQNFIESFMTLNTITFADLVRKEKARISWDVGRVSSP